MASIQQDKPAHMLEIGLDFTPLLMSTAIKCKEKMRDGGPERYGEVVKQLQGRTGQGKARERVSTREH